MTMCFIPSNPGQEGRIVVDELKSSISSDPWSALEAIGGIVIALAFLRGDRFNKRLTSCDLKF
jgi:hypothetical protein